MAEIRKPSENAQAVQAHLAITQSIIQRMASNSASCKAWCIALVSAILVLVADKGKPEYALIALIPTILFFVLDTYYLTLEKKFRDSYDTFIKKLHEGEVIASDLFAISLKGNSVKVFVESISSFSIWLFYVALLATVLIAQAVVL